MLRSHGKNTTGLKPALVERVVKMWLDWYKFELSREGEYQRSILASLRTMPPTYREITPEHKWILKVERMMGLSDAAKYEFIRVSVKKGLPMLSVNKIILSYLR